MEWTTESEQAEGGQRVPAAGSDDGYATQAMPLEPDPAAAAAFASAPPPPPAPPVPTHAAPLEAPTGAPGGYEHCPSCGAVVASDQRYCLECGQRRGEPRLPFMDAVVFMDAMKQPPASSSTPPKPEKRRISPNTALIAGIGTLLLALGIGVLIGRSGNHSTPAAAAPQVVTVPSGAETGAASAGAPTNAGATGKSKKAKAAKKAAEEEKPGGSASTVLPSNPDVKLPPPSTEIGESCDKEVAGCSKNGKFEGTFFGE